MKQRLNKLFGFLVKFGLPLASAVFVVLAVNSVAANLHDPTLKPPPAVPPRSPYADSLAANGMIEPRTESIEIGVPVVGIVDRVFVTVGQRVAKDDPLFVLDSRQLRAELSVRRAEMESARLNLEKLQSLPRPEEVAVYEKRVAEAKVSVEEADSTYERNSRLRGAGGVSEEDMVKSRASRDRAREHQRLAEAELKLQNAGVSKEELAVARQNIAKAQAVVDQVEADLARLTVRAPVDGNILQVQVHPGESVSPSAGRSLMVVGDLSRLHVRVSIDEHEIPRFQAGAGAQALVVGHPELSYALTFVRAEPYVIPKKSLAGDNRERVDTRVLQVIYSLVPPSGAPLYVGQQVNVYLQLSEASPRVN
jgi:multidrug efflux pump subunit AcrA (membrane-fusion protein)